METLPKFIFLDNATEGDTVVISDKTFTFTHNPCERHHIKIGKTLDETLVNLDEALLSPAYEKVSDNDRN